MAKTNYTKVEEALAEGLRKIEVNRLLGAADEASAKKPKEAEPTLTPEQKQLLIAVEQGLKFLKKHGVDAYAKLGVEKKTIIRYLKKPLVTKEKGWKELQSIREKIAALKAEVNKDVPEVPNDEMVDDQRRKQKTKRFNINENWIPLR